MSEDISKGMFTLIGVTLGWLLSQVTDVVKKWNTNRKYKKVLLEELQSHYDQLGTAKEILQRGLRCLAHRHIYADAPAQITTEFYKKYFPDVMPSLNRSQRVSFQLLNRQLEELNIEFKTLRERANRATTTRNADDYQDWENAIRFLFVWVQAIRWLIKYHLDNPDNPERGKSVFDEHNLEFQKQFASFKDEMIAFIETAGFEPFSEDRL